MLGFVTRVMKSPEMDGYLRIVAPQCGICNYGPMLAQIYSPLHTAPRKLWKFEALLPGFMTGVIVDFWLLDIFNKLVTMMYFLDLIWRTKLKYEIFLYNISYIP